MAVDPAGGAAAQAVGRARRNNSPGLDNSAAARSSSRTIASATAATTFPFAIPPEIGRRQRINFFFVLVSKHATGCPCGLFTAPPRSQTLSAILHRPMWLSPATSPFSTSNPSLKSRNSVSSLMRNVSPACDR